MQSQALLPRPTGNGLRRRKTQGQGQAHPQRPLTNWEREEQALLGLEPQEELLESAPRTQNARAQENRLSAMNARLQHLTGLMEQVASTQRAQVEQELAAAEDASATAARIETGVAVVQRGTQDLRQQARDINSKVTESLTLTKRIDKNVVALKRMVAAHGGAGSLMMNPMFALIVFFIMHPYIPVTVEAVMTVWSVLLSGNFIRQTAIRIQRGEDLFDFSGGPIGIVKNIAFSAPHIIVIMYKLSTLWAEERTGTAGYSATNAAAFAETMGPSNWEPFLMQQFTVGMETARNFNMQSLRDTHFQIPQPNMTEWRLYLESASEETWEEVRALDPTLFKDPAGIIQLLLQYIMGKLTIKARSVGAATLNMPAYMYQARTVMTAESWIYQCLFHLFKDIFTRFFKDTWESIVQITCTALCAYSPVMPEEPKVVSASGGGIWDSVTGFTASAYTAAKDKVTSGVSKATSVIKESASGAVSYVAETAVVRQIRDIDYIGGVLGFLARWACDCSKYRKEKMDGGSPKSKTRKRNSKARSNRSKTRGSKRSPKPQHVPAEHAAFLRLSWGFALLTAAPLLLGVPAFPTPADAIALEAEMAKLLLFKLDQGQFVPPFVLQGATAKDYYLL